MSRSRLALRGALAVGVLATVLAGVVAAGVGYAAVTAPDLLSFPDTPYPDVEASTDPEVIERGRYLVHGPAHCSQCHSTSDRTHPEKVHTEPLNGGLAFEVGPIATIYAPNLTPASGLTDAEIARAVRTGVTSSGQLSIFMRYAGAKPSDDDLTAIVSYLRSLEPVPNEIPASEIYLPGKVLFTYVMPTMTPADEPAPTPVPDTGEPSLERGEYLVKHVALCVGCHTEAADGFNPTGPTAGGSLPEPSHGKDHDKEFVAPNLTSHATGLTGRWTEDAFVTRLRGGRVFTSSIMPWEGFETLTDSDARSIYRYLKSLPPVDNDVGPTYRDQGWTP